MTPLAIGDIIRHRRTGKHWVVRKIERHAVGIVRYERGRLTGFTASAGDVEFVRRPEFAIGAKLKLGFDVEGAVVADHGSVVRVRIVERRALHGGGHVKFDSCTDMSKPSLVLENCKDLTHG